jgi:hypothetical protein
MRLIGLAVVLAFNLLAPLAAEAQPTGMIARHARSSRARSSDGTVILSYSLV